MDMRDPNPGAGVRERARPRIPAWVVLACLASPAFPASRDSAGISALAGVSHQWSWDGNESGQTLSLGGGLARGPHLLEARLGWLFHPALGYMTSVDRVATFVYGHALGMGLRARIGFGLYRDYRDPGIPIGLRLEASHAALETYWVGKRRSAVGMDLVFRTGNLF